MTDIILKKCPLVLEQLLQHSRIPVTYFEDGDQKNIGGDYIDLIEPENLDSGISVGVDRWKRPFVCFRLTYHKLDDDTKKEKHVYTIFQRHPNFPSWAMGTTSSTNILKIYETPFVMDSGVYKWKAYLYDYLLKLITIGYTRVDDYMVYLD